jgi:hypothetical protein
VSEDVIDIKPVNVVILPSISQQADPQDFDRILNDAAMLLDLLEFHAGNINAFLSHFTRDASERQRIHYKILKTIEANRGIHQQWNKAVKRSDKARIAALRCTAITNLERYDPINYPRKDDDPPFIKQTNDLANAKLLLGATFESEMQKAKAAFKGSTGSTGDLSGEDTDDEEAALLDAESEDE